MDKCVTCGRVIGKLDTPYVWKGSVVCAHCHARLSMTAPATAATAVRPLMPRHAASPSEQITESCKNCGVMIGNLEKSFLFRDLPVCESCYGRLTGKKAAAPWVPIIISLALVAVCIALATAWNLTRSHEPGPVAVDQSIFAAKPAPALVAIPRPVPPPPLPTAPPAPVVAAAPTAKPADITIGSITGAVWIKRKNGTSDIQRGLAVFLVGPYVSKAELVACLEAPAKDLDDAAALDERRVANWLKEFPSDTDHVKEMADEAKDERSRAKTIRDMIGRLPERLPTGDAYALVAKNSRYLVEIDAAVKTNIYGDATTDENGKYEINAVAAGDYYLYCFSSSEAPRGFIEWMLPVHVTAGLLTKVDLFNSNAATIRND